MTLWLFGVAIGVFAAPAGMWLAAWLYDMGLRPNEVPYIEVAREKMKTGLLVGSMIGVIIIVGTTMASGPHAW